MMHLGQEEQNREVSIISILLDASGDRDDLRLAKYIKKWQKVEKRAKMKCITRKLLYDTTKKIVYNGPQKCFESEE